jgi:hypothetical protein
VHGTYLKFVKPRGTTRQSFGTKKFYTEEVKKEMLNASYIFSPLFAYMEAAHVRLALIVAKKNIIIPSTQLSGLPDQMMVTLRYIFEDNKIVFTEIVITR